jgi:hypothetical protein
MVETGVPQFVTVFGEGRKKKKVVPTLMETPDLIQMFDLRFLGSQRFAVRSTEYGVYGKSQTTNLQPIKWILHPPSPRKRSPDVPH